MDSGGCATGKALESDMCVTYLTEGWVLALICGQWRSLNKMIFAEEEGIDVGAPRTRNCVSFTSVEGWKESSIDGNVIQFLWLLAACSGVVA